MIGSIITNATDGLETNLIGIIMKADHIRRSAFGGGIWKILFLLPNGKLFELTVTDSMLKFLNTKETE